MKNKKKLITTIASLALVGAISIGATLAYLSAQTDVMTNTFTSVGSNLSIQLREPAWDGYQFDDLNNGKQPDGQSAKPGAEADKLGITEAANFAPGSTAAKNPMVKNDSDQDVWVAVVVNTSELPDYVEVAWENGTNWKIVHNPNGTTFAYYKSTLAPKASTEAVFTEVSIPATVKEVDETANYDVTVKAYAIQAANVDDVNAAIGGFAQEFPEVFSK